MYICAHVCYIYGQYMWVYIYIYIYIYIYMYICIYVCVYIYLMGQPDVFLANIQICVFQSNCRYKLLIEEWTTLALRQQSIVKVTRNHIYQLNKINKVEWKVQYLPPEGGGVRSFWKMNVKYREVYQGAILHQRSRCSFICKSRALQV